MASYPMQEPQRLFYTIGEVAKMFRVNVSLIRFWEKEFDILKLHKNKKGNRLFTPQDVENFHVIYHLVKERGYTLQGAKEKLKQESSDTLHSGEVLGSLKKIREFLVELKNNL